MIPLIIPPLSHPPVRPSRRSASSAGAASSESEHDLHTAAGAAGLTSPPSTPGSASGGAAASSVAAEAAVAAAGQKRSALNGEHCTAAKQQGGVSLSVSRRVSFSVFHILLCHCMSIFMTTMRT